jgi:hypothetical protein
VQPQGPGPLAELVSFSPSGEIGGIWPLGDRPTDIVLRDGRLVPRMPTEVLPKDARIADVRWKRDEAGRPMLLLEGANLLLGPRRIAPGRPEPLADGDVLAVDHRDVGEPAGAIVGALLVVLPQGERRPLRCLREGANDTVEVTHPHAGRFWLQAGIAGLVFGALPCAAAALGYPAGAPARSSLLLAAVCCALVGIVALALSRLLARAGPVLGWDHAGLRVARGGPFARPEVLPIERLDGFAIRLGRRPDGGWELDAALRTRTGEVRLDHGPHVRLPADASLPALAALEARRRDWVETAARAARALHRSPDGFVTVTTDPDWPPERAHGVVVSERISLS